MATSEKQTLAGGITTIPDAQSNPEIQALARFAVDEYNKKQGTHLIFKKVLRAREQIVSGTNYYIDLNAADGNKINAYEAKVYVKEWEDIKELQDFKELLQSKPAADA